MTKKKLSPQQQEDLIREYRAQLRQMFEKLDIKPISPSTAENLVSKPPKLLQ